jgi:hypothetical protein
LPVDHRYLGLRPNMRMQSDAALRPQDRVHFGAWFSLDCDLDLSWRRG